MATTIFRGDAQAVPKVYTITPANVETGDKFTLAINGKEISYTATSSSVSAVVSGLVSAITATTLLEWQSVIASANSAGTALTLTGPSGEDFIVTGSTTDATDFAVVVTTLQAGSADQNEIQRIQIPYATGGTFTLSFGGQTTSGLAYNITTGNLETALEGLSTIDAVTVTGSAGDWYVEFAGSLATQNVAALVADGSSLTGGHSVDVETTTQGGPATNTIHTIDASAYTSDSAVTLNLYLEADFGTYTKSLNLSFWSADISSQNGTVETEIESEWGISGVSITELLDSGGIVKWEYGGSLAGIPITGTCYVSGTTTPNLLTLTQAGSSTGTNAVQTIELVNSPGGGTFTLTYDSQTTGTIAYNASAATVLAALEALSNIGSGDVAVTGSDGGPWTVTFQGSLAATDVSEFTGDASSLTGGAVYVSTTQAGAVGVNEKQQVRITGNPSGGTFTLTYDGQTTGNLTYDESAADIETALEALSNINAVAVTGSDGGAWTVEFQGTLAKTNVDLMTGDESNLTGTGSQTLTVAATTAGAGPNWWTDANNWDTGQVPETGDAIVIEDGNSDILWGLDQIATFTATNATNLFTASGHQFVEDQKVRVSNSGGALPSGLSTGTDYYVLNATTDTFQLSASRGGSAVSISDDGTGTHTIAVELASITVGARYTGRVGLQKRNQLGFYEYRPTALQVGLLSSGNKTVLIGRGSGTGSSRLRFDFTTYQVAMTVNDTGASGTANVPACLVKNTNSSTTITVNEGELGLNFYADETGGEIGTLNLRGGIVTLGNGVTISSGIDRTGGELETVGDVNVSGTLSVTG